VGDGANTLTREMSVSRQFFHMFLTSNLQRPSGGRCHRFRPAGGQSDSMLGVFFSIDGRSGSSSARNSSRRWIAVTWPASLVRNALFYGRRRRNNTSLIAIEAVRWTHRPTPSLNFLFGFRPSISDAHTVARISRHIGLCVSPLAWKGVDRFRSVMYRR